LRNNGDRLTASPDVSHDQSTATTNTLDFVVPTDFVELPSGGIFYPVGHSLHGQQQIEIRHMTAKEEDILTSQTLIKKGIAVDKMIQSILLDKRINVDTILTCDRSAIMVAARITGYGDDYKFSVNCPACEKKDDIAYQLSSSKINSGKNHEEGEVEYLDDGTFIITLPKTGYRVQMRLLTGKDERTLFEINDNRKRKNLLEAAATDQLRMSIVSVNGVSDQQTLDRFISTVRAMDAKLLRTMYKKVSPALLMQHDFSCSSCAYTQEVEVPLTAEFFWPK